VLGHFRAEALPFLYVGAATVAAALTGASAARRERRPRAPFLLCLMGALASALFAVASSFGAPGASWVLYLFAESFTTYAAIQFWASMGVVFDPLEARRAFTTLSGIGMVGGMLGGFLAQVLAHTLGAAGLLGVSAVLLAAGASALAAVHIPDRLPVPRHRSDTSHAWGFLGTSDYGRLLAGFILCLSVVSALADYLFRQRAAEQLGVDELAALFGNLSLWMALVAVVFQLVIAERLVRRLGILRYLSLVPVALLALAGVAWAVPTLWPAYALRLVEQAASLSILPVALQLLYSPVPDSLRDGVRSAMDGFVKKGGLALAGLALIGAGHFVDGPVVPAAVAALCVLSLAVLWRFRPAYLGVLKSHVSGADESVSLGLDGADARRLEEALHDPDPEHALRAASLLEQRPDDLRGYLPALLEHRHERVQTRGIQLAVHMGAVEALAHLEVLTASKERRPRDEAVWGLAQLAPDRAAELLPPLLAAPDVGLRCAAIGALMSTRAGPNAQSALQALLARGAAAPVGERREVARLLGRLKDPGGSSALARYLEDPDGSVRRIAIAGAGDPRFAELAPRILAFLTWREERRAARESLVAMGPSVLPLLETTLNDRSRPVALRYQVPRVLRQTGNARALEALLFSNPSDDAFLHYRIGVALSRLREDHPELPVDGQRVREAIGRRRESYRTLVTPFRDLRAGLGDGSLLTRAVGDRLDQSFEIAFWLLGLLYPAKPLRRVHGHLVRSEGRAYAYAMELFENVVPVTDRGLVLEQIEAHHRRLPVGAAGRVPEHLAALAGSDDIVMRACVRRVAGGLGVWKGVRKEDDMSEETVDRMFALEKVEIFAQSDVDDVAAVAAIAREERYAKGERIYAEGDPGDALYVLLRGEAHALKHGELVLTVHENQAFGEVSLLDGAPRPTDMVVAEDAEVLAIDRRDFLDLVSDRPELLRGLFRAMSQQLTRIIDLNARRGTGEVPKAG
jgi:HEAT repeat protein